MAGFYVLEGWQVLKFLHVGDWMGGNVETETLLLLNRHWRITHLLIYVVEIWSNYYLQLDLTF